MTNDPIVDRVIRRHIARSRRGMETYGTSIYDNDTKSTLEWIEEAIEECLDQVIYLEKLLDQYKKEYEHQETNKELANRYRDSCN